MPERPPPPILVIHGENDLLVEPSHAREFVERMRAGSSHPAEYVELPGGHHDFDLYESIRSNAVNVAVERFIMRSGRSSIDLVEFRELPPTRLSAQTETCRLERLHPFQVAFPDPGTATEVGPSVPGACAPIPYPSTD